MSRMKSEAQAKPGEYRTWVLCQGAVRTQALPDVAEELMELAEPAPPENLMFFNVREDRSSERC